jgi:type II secretory pathway pseudopilin PulG
MNGIGRRRRVKAAVLLLRACRQAARDDQHDGCEYPVSYGCEEGHQKSAAS